ncbi:MAG TPA: ABC transporter permease subunit, partial [Anaerolineales bacterium]
MSPWLARIALWLLPLSFLFLAFFLPLARIFALTLDPQTLSAGNLLLAARVLLFTFYQATLSTLLTLLLGLPAAYLFARYNFRGKSLLRALTAVPFMLPTVVVAAGFNALLGQRGLINNLIHPSSFILHPFMAILIAHVFYNTTIIIRVVGNALSSLDPRLEAAARSLGAEPSRVWWNVTFPLLRPSLLASSLLVFLFDFTSFGVILLLGGSQFATLEVEIYVRVLRLPNLPLAALLSVIQLLCTILVSILYSRFASRSTIQTTPRSEQSNLRKPNTLREKLLVGT